MVLDKCVRCSVDGGNEAVVASPPVQAATGLVAWDEVKAVSEL